MRILLRILGVVMLLALALPAQAHTGFGIVVDREVTQWFHTHRVVEIGGTGQMKTVANVGGGGGYVLSVVLAGMVLGT